jgi:glyoxylate/hydroxypyruvate reductase A
VIINVARGEHLDEAALLEYLDNGKIAAAVLDVFRTEPLPADHPFWSHPSIRVTPHISGTTDVRLAMKQIARNIEAYRTGGALTGVVDRARGY